eukprot:Nk52_evm16s24 gene=Nk52_evmTU16s24
MTATSQSDTKGSSSNNNGGSSEKNNEDGLNTNNTNTEKTPKDPKEEETQGQISEKDIEIEDNNNTSGYEEDEDDRRNHPIQLTHMLSTLSLPPGELESPPSLDPADVNPEMRISYANNPEKNSMFRYCNNKIKTTKYTPFTFIFINLFEQFHRAANCYFLFMTILAFIPYTNAINPFTAFVPLLFVLTVSASKEGVEDYKRGLSDEEVNHSLTHALRNGEFVEIMWKNVSVGDIIRVDNNEGMPADVVLLRTSEEAQVCYIETANLDGETNLKVKESHPATKNELKSEEAFSRFNGYVEYEPANNSLLAFVGNIWCVEGDAYKVNPVTMANIVLRGCTIRNTKEVYGLVIYTGHDTKIMMNDSAPRLKRTNIEIMMNREIIKVFILLVILCFVGGAMAGIWQKINNSYNGRDDVLWYLDPEFHPVVRGILNFFSFSLILQSLVPISLYVSVELVKVVQAYFIGQDIGMYHEETDTPAKARTSTLSEELGQIQYILSDKTGTLTQNKMEFFGCTIGGKAYGMGLNPEDAGPPPDTRTKGDDDSQSFNDCGLQRPYARAGFTFEDVSLFEDLLIHDPLTEGYGPQVDQGRVSFISSAAQEEYFGLAQNILSREFFRHMALCHSVIPEIAAEEHDESNAKTIFYQAQSPDESALVSAARDFGFTFLDKVGTTLNIDVLGKKFSYELLHYLEFTSTRKRMSVIVRCPVTKKVVLLCKGADDVIFDRMAADVSKIHVSHGDMYLRDEDGTVPIGASLSLYATDPEFYASVKESTAANLRDFASLGLRTLCFSMKYIEESEYEDWKARYFSAETDHDNREEKMFALADEIERGMVLIGATAVEDKLQAGVPECIATLMQATIKVWVLTGDKQETAINIGFSSCLLTEDMTVIVVNAKDLVSTQEKLLEVKKQYFGGELSSTSYGDEDSEEALMFKLKNLAKNFAFWNAQGKDGLPFENTASADPSERRVNDSCADSYSNVNRQCALVIDGGTLQYALTPECEKLFLDIALQCCSVVCCRCSPLQKSSVVRLVRSGTDAKVLAIGDGANDVSMIRAADVGVGISGKEGLQAVLASDYAFAQFRFLTRLLLVHGRWSYNRICWMILYFFYKNYAFVLSNFWFAFFSGFSAQTVYENVYIMLYNLVFTSLPPMFVAVFDQDLPDVAVISVPELYTVGLKNSKFNSRVFWWTVLEAIFQSLVFFFVPMLAVCGVRYSGQFVSVSSVTPSGESVGMWLLGTAIYLGCVTVVNLRVALDTQNWTWMNHVVTWCSIGAVYLFILAFSYYPAKAIPIFGNDAYGVASVLYVSGAAWFAIVMVIVMSLAPYFIYNWYKIQTDPSDTDIVREMWQYKVGVFSEEFMAAGEEIEGEPQEEEPETVDEPVAVVATKHGDTLTPEMAEAIHPSHISFHRRTLSQGSRGSVDRKVNLMGTDFEMSGSTPELNKRVPSGPRQDITGSHAHRAKRGHMRAQTSLGAGASGMATGTSDDDASALFSRRKSNSARRALSNQSLYNQQTVLSSESLHARRAVGHAGGHRRFLSDHAGVRSTPNIPRDVEDNLHYRSRYGHRRRSTVVAIADDLTSQPISHTGFAFN